MKELLLTALVGLVIGTIDILPMIKMKIDKYATLSAFTFYLIMPFLIYNIKFLNNKWWLSGLVVLILELPILILVAKEDKKGIIPIIIMAIVLGTIIGFAGNILGLI